MATNTIKLKRNTTNSNAPDTDDIAEGEIALNTVSGKLYMRKSDDSIVNLHVEDTKIPQRYSLTHILYYNYKVI